MLHLSWQQLWGKKNQQLFALREREREREREKDREKKEKERGNVRGGREELNAPNSPIKNQS